MSLCSFSHLLLCFHGSFPSLLFETDFPSMWSIFMLNLEIRKFNNTINKHRDIPRKFITRLERDVRPLVQSLPSMCSLLFCSERFIYFFLMFMYLFSEKEKVFFQYMSIISVKTYVATFWFQSVLGYVKMTANLHMIQCHHENCYGNTMF